MNKILIFLLAFSLLFSIFPVYGFSNEIKESTEFPTYENPDGIYEVRITGLVSPNIKEDVSVILLIRNCDTGTEYVAPLYGYNDYITTIQLSEPGYYEIYKAFYANQSIVKDFPVEYVKFVHYGNPIISVSIVIGDTDSFNESDDAGFRLNKIGETYSGKPENIVQKNQSYEEYVIEESFGPSTTIPMTSNTTSIVTSTNYNDGIVGDTSSSISDISNTYEETSETNFIPIIISVLVLSGGLIYYLIKKKRS